jgi:sugar O-acyltransferase (sialic acid O-acetyltransferase NeuD family)
MIGGGGHASGILGAFEAIYESVDGDFPVIGFVDDSDVDDRRFRGRNCKQLGAIGDLPHIDATHYILAIGFSNIRKKVFDRIKNFGLKAASVIHPAAEVHRNVVVGEGSVILSGTYVGPGAKVGSHVYVASGSTVEHDCQIGDFTTIMPNAAVSGDTFLGDGCLIGTNATVLQGVSIGADATVGAGAVVLKNVPADVVVVGNPAKPR